MDAIAMLKTQHAEVDALFEKLAHETDAADWHDLLGRLVDRLTMHAALEEEIFYPAVATVADEAALVRHARDEHRKVKTLLEPLRDPHARKETCQADLQELRRTVEHHVAEEERDLMPRAAKLGAAGLRDVGHEMEVRIHAGETSERKVAGGRVAGGRDLLSPPA